MLTEAALVRRPLVPAARATHLPRDVGWAWGVCWSVQLFLSSPVGPSSAGGQGVAGRGGERPIMLFYSASQCVDQGQWVGRCRTGRRCGRASRAGMLMILRRSVEARARVCWSPASTPAARSRLWEIAAHRIQAELAPKRPEGRCARGPSIRSANAVSMMACWRWVPSSEGPHFGCGWRGVPPTARRSARCRPGMAPTRPCRRFTRAVDSMI
jgi:hypothetical protein